MDKAKGGVRRWKLKDKYKCPGVKIRSKGRGRGLGYGKGRGPIGRQKTTKLKPIPRSKLPKGWKPSRYSLGKTVGGAGIYFPTFRGMYIDIGAYGWQPGYEVVLASVLDEKEKPIHFSDSLFSKGRYLTSTIRKKDARTSNEANRIALQFMREVNKGKYGKR